MKMMIKAFEPASTHIRAVVPKMFCLRFQDFPKASPIGFYFPYGGSACLHRLIKLVMNFKPGLVLESSVSQHNDSKWHLFEKVNLSLLDSG